MAPLSATDEATASPPLTRVPFPAGQRGVKVLQNPNKQAESLHYNTTMQQTPASITRPNLGSLAYVWIGDKEHVVATTSEAHDLMIKRGKVTFIRRSGSTEYYTIERNR